MSLCVYMCDRVCACMCMSVCVYVCVYVRVCILVQDVYGTMECFESLFTRAYARADGTRASFSPQVTLLHHHALRAWALLLTICPPAQLHSIISK